MRKRSLDEADAPRDAPHAAPLPPPTSVTPSRGVRSLVSDTVVYGLARAMLGFAGLLLLPLYTRYFAVAEYGIIENLNAVGYFVLMLFGGALPTALVQFYVKTEAVEERRRIVSSAVYATVALAAVLLLAGVPLAGYLGSLLVRRGAAENTLLLGLAFVGYSATLQVGLLLSAFRARFATRHYLVASLGSVLLMVILNLVFVVGLDLGVGGTLLAALLAQMGATVYGLVVLGDEIRLRSVAPTLLREMLAFGIPFMIAGVLGAVIRYSDRYFLSALLRDPLPQIGLYSMAEKCMAPLSLASYAFGMAWAPFALAVSKQANAREVYVRTFKYYVGGTSLMLVAGSALAPFVLRVFATPPYYPSALFTPAVGLYLSMNYLYYIGSLGMLLTQRSVVLAPLVGVAALVNAGLNVLWIPRWEVAGAIWATVAALVVYNFLIYAVGERYHRVGFPLLRGFAVYAAAYLAGCLALRGILAGLVALAAFAVAAHLLGFLEVERLPGLVVAIRRRLAQARRPESESR